jgi:hypothetical protein
MGRKATWDETALAWVAWAFCEAAFRAWDWWGERDIPRWVNAPIELSYRIGNRLYAIAYLKHWEK